MGADADNVLLHRAVGGHHVLAGIAVH
jgi:hypothetical protein